MKEIQWNKKKKYIGTALAFVFFSLLIGLYFYFNRTPSFVIAEPTNGFTVQASEISIKGTIDPKDATLNINSTIVKTENGNFNYIAKLEDKINTFTLKVSNNNGESQQKIIINRTFTDKELAEYERQKAEEEAKKQIALETRKKAAEERNAKESAIREHEIKEENSNAYKLAFIEVGGKPPQLLVNQFDSLLKTLNKKCTEDEQKISDIIVKTQELLEKKSKKETLLDIARSINESIPEELTGSTSCAEIAGMLVTLIDMY